MGLGGENVQRATLHHVGDLVGGGEIFLMKAPRDLTVLDAYMTAQAAQNAGTAVLMALQNWGTAGTAVEGTVAAALGGTATAARLSANTPAAATITAAQAYIDEGEWLVIDITEEGDGWIAGDAFTYEVHYVFGKVG